MGFKDKYTTQKLKEKGDDAEQEKIELSNETFALLEALDDISAILRSK